MTATTLQTATITIDGQEVTVPVDKTILDAARSLGIEIPTLCHNDSLKPYGSCWVCAVKVEGARSLVPSCSTQVRDGMKVITTDDEVRQTRKLCLELLLSDHHGDCTGPCQTACPAGIDVQGYIAHAARGEYAEAVRLIKQKNPLPLICGRVCPRPCEDNCRRNLVDEAVAVDSIKRYIADWDRRQGAGHYMPPKAESTGKSVAVVGGGPAGLTCAYFLAQRGHAVTIYEALPRLGGMLIWGIPSYRLPRDVLDAEIDTILELGVEAKCDMRLGKDITLADLEKDYDSVFLGLGATESRKMRVEGEDLPGVMSGTDFLRRFGLEEEFDFKGKSVAVIGGGNTAVDAARTSLRLGAKEVTMIYRRSRAEMPAQDIEVEDAEKEGIKFHFLAAPTKLSGTDKLESLEYIRMELGEPDASGRRRPVQVEGSEESIEVDVCIAAIGQVPSLEEIDSGELQRTDWGTLAADEKSLAMNAEGVFAGGDCVHGAATVIEAVAHGREAAISIDRHLRGESITRSEPLFNISKGNWKELDPADFEHFLKTKRQHMSCLELADRIATFDEVEKGLTEEQVSTEAARCLECGCSATFDCRVRGIATEYDAHPERFEDGDARQELPDDRHPLISLEMQKCIMCGSCVRVCDEIRDVRALGFEGRGFNARVRPAFGESMLDAGCISCGACVDICPTGAITERLGKEGGPFVLIDHTSACLGCGVGCAVDTRTAQNGKLISVRASLGAPNTGSVCLRGHFGHRALTPDERLTIPMIRENGELRNASLDEALGRAVELMQDAGKEGVITVSPHASYEEMELAAALSAKTGATLGSLGVSAETAAMEGLSTLLDHAASPRSVAELPAADCVLLVECDPMTSHPVAGVQSLAATRADGKLAIIATAETRLDRHADLRLRPRTGTAHVVLAGIARKLLAETEKGKHLPEKVRGEFMAALELYVAEAVEEKSEIAPDEIADLAARLAEAKNPIIVIDTSRAGAALARLAAMVAVIIQSEHEKTAPLLALRSAANSHGLTRLGINPLTLAECTGKTVLAIREDIVTHAQDLSENWQGTLIVMDCIHSESSATAEVVLPLPAPFEIYGTLFATGGLRQTLTAATPAGGEDAVRSLATLAEKAGAHLVEGKEIIPQLRTEMTADLSALPANEEVCTACPSADSFTRLVKSWADKLGLL